MTEPTTDVGAEPLDATAASGRSRRQNASSALVTAAVVVGLLALATAWWLIGPRDQELPDGVHPDVQAKPVEVACTDGRTIHLHRIGNGKRAWLESPGTGLPDDGLVHQGKLRVAADGQTATFTTDGQAAVVFHRGGDHPC